MAWSANKEITMDIEEGFDFIIEEGQNTSINLRKISWNGRPTKLDLRKWSYNDGTERAMKGVSFTDEGADELSAVLVEQGFGETKRLIKAIKAREDYNGSFSNDETYVDNESEEYYDPSELLGDY
jgi:hypothetical protein